MSDLERQIYERLNLVDRSRINQEVDIRFSRKTGIGRKLDPAKPSDRQYIQEWLKIRDQVVKERYGNRSNTAQRDLPQQMQPYIEAMKREAGIQKEKYFNEFLEDAKSKYDTYALLFSSLGDFLSGVEGCRKIIRLWINMRQMGATTDQISNVIKKIVLAAATNKRVAIHGFRWFSTT